MAELPSDLPVKAFKDAAGFEKWLKIARKDSGIASVTYGEALDVALCHGWIDGQKKGFDERFFLQRFTPRRKRSLWSKNNVGHVARLIEAGRMREGGHREIEAAKSDGRWAAAYHGASKMEVPPELIAALAKNGKAKVFFESLNKTNRYAFCWRVQSAVKMQTKIARVKKLVAMLARGEKFHD